MADYPALTIWTDAYLADTMDLSAEEHGVYLLLLMAACRSPECALPDDDARLARMARIGIKKWRNMRPVMERFWTIDDRGWTQKRLLKERERNNKYRSQKSQAGKASALKRNNTASTAVGTEKATGKQLPNTSTSTSNSVPNGTGASRAVDPAKPCYDFGKPLLQRYEHSASKAGGLITKWLKAHPPEVLLPVLQNAASADRHDIVAFIEGALKNGKTQQTESVDRAGVLDRFRARGEGGGGEGVGGAGRDVDPLLPAVPGRH